MQSGAQGTIEYLVVLAVVIVIGLVVVALMSTTFSNPAQQLSSASSQIGSMTGPIAITEAVADSEGDARITLANNSGDTVSLSKVIVGDTTLTFDAQVPPMGEEVFSISDIENYCSCEGFVGSTITCRITVVQGSEYFGEKSKEFDISVSCVDDAAAANEGGAVQAVSVCGNDEVDGAEVCDGMDLGAASGCSYFGDFDGTLLCESGCAGYDSGGCFPMKFIYLPSDGIRKLDMRGNLKAHYSNSSLGLTLYVFSNVDSQGNVWVTSEGSVPKTVKIGPSGDILVSVTLPPTSYPDNAAIDAFDNLWIPSANLDSVIKVASDGNILGTYPAGNGANAVAIDRDNNIWVANNYAGTISKLNQAGQELGEFLVPQNSSNYLNSIAADPDGNIYVSTMTGYIIKFGSSGQWLRTFSPGLRPWMMVAALDGNIWFTRYNITYSSVNKMTPEGQVLFSVNLSAGTLGHGIAADFDGNVWAGNIVGTSHQLAKISPSGEVLFNINYPSYFRNGCDPTGFVLHNTVLRDA